jgi:hypothetical protein
MRKLLVLLSAVALMVAFTVPAIAADKSVSFYGRVWMDTFIEDTSKEATGTNFDDSDLRWNLQDNGTSRFGANFKWDSMSANVEIRPWSASVYRQWWGMWDFGGGKLLIGHTWSPLYINATVCSQCEAGGTAGGYGFWVGDLRRAQVQLRVGGLTLALVEPSAGAVAGAAGYDTDTTIPKLEVTYALKLGSIALVPFLGWQSYDIVNTATDVGYGVDGMVYGITAKAGFGPVYVNGQIWMTQNGKEWGDLYHTGFGAFFDGTKIVDEDGMGFGLEAGMKMSDTMSFAVGYGSVEYELDRPGTWEDDASSMYAQLNITIAKGFMVTPEIGVIDYGDQINNGVTTKEGDFTYYGAVWKIHF